MSDEKTMLMSKAGRACESARILLACADIDGACNRAYYAMFDAARAAVFIEAMRRQFMPVELSDGG
jgi:uncharacterized protein (UPF0332 family)